MNGKLSRKKLLIGASLAALVGAFAFVASSIRAQQFEPFPHRAQIGGLGPLSEPAGYLGISMQEVTADQAKQLKLPAVRGIFVASVVDNSPASKAGIQKGDVITAYNGQVVEGTLQFGRLVRETPPGHTAQVSVWRDGRAQTLTVELGEARGPLGGAVPAVPGIVPEIPQFRYPGFGATPVLGIAVQNLSGQLGNYFGVPTGEGVLVTDVQKDSAGDKAGLKAGDVITKVDGQALRNVADLRGQLREKRNAGSVTLGVLRKGVETSVTAQLERSQSPLSLPGARPQTSIRL